MQEIQKQMKKINIDKKYSIKFKSSKMWVKKVNEKT